MALSDYAYTNATLDFEVLLDGDDISEYVADIPSISKSTDNTHQFGEYRVGEAELRLNDAEGLFSPNNDANWFISKSLRQSGLGTKVEIKAKYATDPFETLFIGEVIECDYDMDAARAETRIIASDGFHKLFSQDITDFGLEKQFKLVESTEEQDLHGSYPLPEPVQPPSDGSTTVKKSVSDTLTEVPEIATRGALSEDNYEVADNAIRTETPITSPATGYPQIEMKAPFRHISVKSVIEKVIAEVGITQSDIEIPEVTTSAHFRSVGRPGYEVIGSALVGTGNPLDWIGHPTDFIYENGVFYYLYSGMRGKSGRSMLLSYTQSTDTWTVLWRVPVVSNATTEIWKMAKNGNDMAILCTDADIQSSGDGALPDVTVPGIGTYNAKNIVNKVYIIKRDITQPVSNTTVVTLVAKNAAIKAQLSHHYVLGQTYSDPRATDAAASVPAQQPPTDLPDSRRKIIWYNNELYFCGIDSASVGVAKVASVGGTPSWVEKIDQDSVNNESGLFFDIVGSRLYILANFRRDASSRALAWTKNL